MFQNLENPTFENNIPKVRKVGAFSELSFFSNYSSFYLEMPPETEIFCDFASRTQNIFNFSNHQSIIPPEIGIWSGFSRIFQHFFSYNFGNIPKFRDSDFRRSYSLMSYCVRYINKSKRSFFTPLSVHPATTPPPCSVMKALRILLCPVMHSRLKHSSQLWSLIKVVFSL